ncbi:MAG: NAD(P)/FAD-dependent oxidoreductase, partial [Gammaproteobacteria bacterium]|nr:NAD(P)/FAD-dependent oxidoreductase [Gammaproteobacteria bacterium]
WNRYPGARFDSESWTYGYGFSKELMQEWDWKEHYSPQPDTLEYLNYVANKFDLRRDIQFDSRVTAARFDDAANVWTVTRENGETATAPFLFTAIGVLSTPTLPRIPGRESFEGAAYHPGLWPHEPVDFTGKRVGIIGTGATAIQAIPEIAKQAEHLTVFQRRPNWAAPLHNSKISKAEMEEIKSRYDEIYAHCRSTSSWFIHQSDPRKTFDVSPDEREAFWEKLYGEPGFGIWLGNFRDILTDERANAEVSKFVAKKIRERVEDPAVANLLVPKAYGFGTRRVPLEMGYYEAYNRDNVDLVDLRETPVECITPHGVRTTAGEHELDMLIYATGFDGVTGPYDRIDIRTSTGRVLREDWAEGLPRTYLGVQTEGYPNMLMILGPHTARGNIPRNSEQIVDFVTGLVGHMHEHGLTRVEPRVEAVDEWGQQVEKVASVLLASQIKSWQTGVNRNVAGRDVLRVLGYNGSAVKYRKLTERVAAEGYAQFLMD